MGGLFAFAVLAGADPRCTFVAADAGGSSGVVDMGGKVFVAHRRGEVAACVMLDETQCFDGIRDLRRFAARGELTAVADIEDQGGMSVITGLRLYRTSACGSATAWVAGQSRDSMAPASAAWAPYVTLASSGQPALPMPACARPEGDGAPCEVSITGPIGGGRYGAAEMVERVQDAAGRSIILHLDSEGGSVDDGLPLYRALVKHKHAVHALITRAESMACIVALSADCRLIAPDGRMHLHQPYMPDASGIEAADLRSLADRLDRVTSDFIGIVAARANVGLGDAGVWINDGQTFTAAEAVQAGLAHGVLHDMAPALPRASRARFRPISGPFISYRPASAPPPLYGHGHRYRVGDRCRFNGRVYVATAATFGAPGLQPDRDPERWAPA